MAQRVYYLAVDSDVPSGGVRVLYRHVDILNAAGVDAAVVHQTPGFRCSWFQNRTRIVNAEKLNPTPDDVLVIPEVYPPEALAFAPGVRKVIFNQNGFFTFNGFPPDFSDTVNPYAHPDLLAVMVVSEHVDQYVQYAFPWVRTERVRPSVDERVFRPGNRREPRICFMPRRNPGDARQVFEILKARGELRGLEILPLDQVSAETVANVLGNSALFFSFGTEEGFGLPPAEAMACGCLVVGYHGFGGLEFFGSDWSFPVDAHDVLDYAAKAGKAIELWRNDEYRYRRMTRAARGFINENYSVDRERQSVLEAWKRMLE